MLSDSSQTADPPRVKSGRRWASCVGRGLQDFAEAEESGNEVGQKIGSPCFCRICRVGL